MLLVDPGLRLGRAPGCGERCGLNFDTQAQFEDLHGGTDVFDPADLEIQGPGILFADENAGPWRAVTLPPTFSDVSVSPPALRPGFQLIRSRMTSRGWGIILRSISLTCDRQE
ncbi:hypothetical protein AMJ97_PA00076 (plasmid) [Rhizobium sp. N1314]|nr:hypothetical protein AMK02_PA00076 [Rhizobium sp. N731]ANL18100.1 hypothetical protein AMJ97_PA00076 [Rhizobium sp. N1314]